MGVGKILVDGRYKDSFWTRSCVNGSGALASTATRIRRCLRALSLAALFLAGPAAAEHDRFITLASTTSTEQSGLFERILPMFKQQTGIEVHVVAVGTGQALAIGARGDADALLVHDRPGEDKFIADGHGIDRRD